MNQSELETLLADVEELKRAVRRNNPFLRQVVAGRFFAVLSIPFGLFVVAFCTGTQILVTRLGSFSAVPAAWKITAGIFLALFFVIGSSLKWSFLARQARKVEEGANFWTVIRSIYGGTWLHLNVPAMLCAVLVPVLAILAGHPWYIAPGIAIFLAIPSNSMGLIVDRPEYLAAGWYALISGLVSLFFIEALPFVWAEVIWGGYLLVFGLVGLAVKDRGDSA
jgi:hypothetical protein